MQFTEIEIIPIVVIGAILFAISVGFNGSIDDNPPKTDGQTAERVAIGSLYTQIGIALALALLFGWRIGLASFGVSMFMYFCSGLPMWHGDKTRSHRLRGQGRNGG